MFCYQSPLQFLFLPSWPWPVGRGQEVDVTLGNPSAWAAAEMPPTQPVLGISRALTEARMPEKSSGPKTNQGRNVL